MTTKMNENIDAGNIERVHDWNEIYDKIDVFIRTKGQIDEYKRNKKRFSTFIKQ